jgi:putative oxidoreductase
VAPRIPVWNPRGRTAAFDAVRVAMIDFRPLESLSYAALRVVAGLAFSVHGVQKIFGILTTKTPEVGSQLWFGGLIELVCGLLIALGLFTRPAAFLASGTMAVAYIQFHWKFAFDERFFPVKNGGELALIYCFLFLFITFRGAGPAALDGLVSRRR